MTCLYPYLSWPGKSPVEGSDICHPAVYHMLDVGAVLNLLLRRVRFDEPLHQALCLLGTLHDIGKINPGFRAMIEDGATQSDRHWQISMAYLDHLTGSVLGFLGNEHYVKEPLYSAVAGHHGGPPTDLSRDWSRMIYEAGDSTLIDVKAATQDICGLFPDASLSQLGETIEEVDGQWQRSSSALSWWLPGIVSVADWIGSNTDWFPTHTPDVDVPTYWSIAAKHAESALRSCGMDEARPSADSVSHLFKFREFTPMQQAVLDVKLPDGPTLAVIEDSTGSGKTEAGLMLVKRMMQAGKGQGLFFALPTMATANAMYSRLRAMRRMFLGNPSLALMHSRARFVEEFREVLGRKNSEPDGEISCADWFLDGRRKALLAQVGVGTIDQALLGVLPTRYFSLRLYALSRQILVVDEAHDYDPYMQLELERLLMFQGMLGGSAILMTATLPQAMRGRFVAAFKKGAQLGSADFSGNAYPQLSLVGKHVNVKAVDSLGDGKGPVRIERIESFELAIDLLVKSADAGAACAFIRNSVDEAIAAVSALRERGVEALLHHARFALFDRLQNESRILNIFGKSGSGRKGSVVVGTQVLEQSLDIDFDFMISDLAPIGALIQRAGRLWRHEEEHPSSERPLDEPLLNILSPDPADVTDANWGRDILGNGWFVYSLPVLWRTAHELFNAGYIEAPDSETSGNVRELIEAVDGDSRKDVPEHFLAAENEWLGSQFGDRAHAQQNLLKPLTDDYRSAQSVFSDEAYPTRLGPPQIILRLARWLDESLVPWSADEDYARAWAMSEVSVSKVAWSRVGGLDQNFPAIETVRNGLKSWEKEMYVICPIEEGGNIGVNGVTYSETTGLVFPRQTGDDPE